MTFERRRLRLHARTERSWYALRGSPLARRGAAWCLALLAISVVLVLVTRQSSFRYGLTARYFGSADFSGDPALTVVDGAVEGRLAAARAREARLDRFSVVWDGVLHIAEGGDYEFSLESDDGSWLWVDGDLVIDNGGTHAPTTVTGSRRLEAGYHPITIRYFQAGGDMRLSLAMARRPAGLRRVPYDALAPSVLSHRVAGAVSVGFLWLPFVWGLTPLGIWAGAVWRAARASGAPEEGAVARHALPALLALGTVVNVAGIWWGLPAYHTWAGEEITPTAVMRGMEVGFSGGWHYKYPPFHYLVLAVLLLPFEVGSRLGLVNVWAEPTHMFMFLLFRGTSVLMATSTLYVVYLCGLELHGRRAAALWGVFLAAMVAPFVYHAKTANLDVPYTWWWSVAFLAYLRALRDVRPGLLITYAVFGALSICTKDQAYGYFVLPTIYLVWRRTAWMFASAHQGTLARRILTDPALVGATVAFVVTFALAQNLIFNPGGFWPHVQLLLGGASQSYRMTGSVVAGQVELLWEAVRLFRFCVGWPAFIVGLAGAWQFLRDDGARRALVVGLPFLSYYLTFIAVVGYHYDRFFLGTLILFSMLGGRALAGWQLAEPGRFGVRRAAVAATAAYSLLYAASVDGFMIADSRYAAERWLAEQSRPGVALAYMGPLQYMPRPERFGGRSIKPTREDLAASRADWLVVNVGFLRREDPPGAPTLADRLDARADYRVERAWRTRLWWAPLGYEPRMADAIEDPFTMLDKINPEIRVYRREPPSAAP